MSLGESQRQRGYFYKLILTPTAHTDGAAASFRDELQLLVSTQQRRAWLGATPDFSVSASAHTTHRGGPLCPMLSIGGWNRGGEKKKVIARI